MYIHVGNETVPIFQLTFTNQASHNITRSLVTNLVILRHYVFLVLDGKQLLRGEFTKSGVSLICCCFDAPKVWRVSPYNRDNLRRFYSH